MSDAATWRPVVERLGLPNPVVTINRRGRVPSGPLGADYSVRTEIDDLHHILDALGAAVELFGWSYGGLIALEAACERSDLRSVIAYEPVSAPFAPAAIPALRVAVNRGDLDAAVRLVNTDVSGFPRNMLPPCGNRRRGRCCARWRPRCRRNSRQSRPTEWTCGGIAP
ncbi:alpha/beta hydrolase [Nocardia sp. NRRL WC-3656]|uniref:alpha/beta hydrolase n=1 Tax=Nocardia sp. NRRL WC-3656 TaxID=1463824 RepID=UPI0006897E90|nr:alpha/beta hydrolase [Nocardia sp. NRRL WC-3656]